MGPKWVRINKFWSLSVLVLFLIGLPIVLKARSNHPQVSPERLREGGFIDGTYPGNWKDTARKDLNFQRITSGPHNVFKRNALSVDQGNISVIQDDGSIVFYPNGFDLDNSNLHFAPNGIGYLVNKVAKNFDPASGSFPVTDPGQPTFGDDSTRFIPFSGGFLFTFFGHSYNGLYVGSDGHITFGSSEVGLALSGDRDVVRFEGAQPRIAPLFVDLLPPCGGSVSTLQRSDRFIVLWNDVPNYSDTCTSANRTHNTFEAVLFQDGSIEFSYNGIQTPQAVVGIAPGNNRGGTSPMLDYTTLASPTAELGAIFEYFTTTTQVSFPALTRKFYQSHGDDYDFVTAFTDFNFDMGNAFAFEENVKNEVQGLGGALPVFDNTQTWGSQTGRLRSFLNLGPIGQYPSDPHQTFLGTNSTVEVIGQEFGHRWMAFADIPGAICQDPTFTNSILGRDCAHWSFFFNSHGSVMEGNDIIDNGNGTFTTTNNATSKYSDMDQYLMGLLGPSQVQPTFAVFNPVTSRRNSSPPAINVTFSGTRHNVTVNDIITANGVRNPSVATAPKSFRQGWILLIPKGQSPGPGEVNQADTIRQAWQSFFSTATNSLGSLDTTLAPSAFLASIPANGGSSKVSSGVGPLAVSYGQIAASTSSQPVALAIFSLTQNNTLVTEAGVPAAIPSTASRVFVDYDSASGRDSGVALINPGNSLLTLIVTLTSQSGLSSSCPNIQLPPLGHTALFASQMGCTGLTNPFLGTLSFSAAAPFAAVNLRTANNAHGQTIFSALPVADPTTPPPGANLIFPQIVDGGGTPTQILLMNTASSFPISGTVSLFDDNGNPVQLDFGSGPVSSLSYSIPANGMVKYSTTGLGPIRVGYAVVTSTSGQLPSGAAVFGSSTTGGLASQAGVLNAVPTTSGRVYIERSTSPLIRNTGIALVNLNGASTSATVTLNLVSLDATFNQTITLNVTPNGHVAKFIDQLFSAGVVPADFQGVLTLISNAPVALVTLRLTANQIGDNLYSTLPVANLNAPPSGTQYLPQIVNGGGYSTQIILINTSTGAGNVGIAFFDDNGNPTVVSFQ